MNTAERHLRRALELAERARGHTSPNPMVGAVVVRRGQVAGEGWHHRAGLPHAEIEAFRAAGARARGADLYVTLEPCTFFGRTPPCVDAVIAAGIRRVWIGTLDPNPRVAGEGVRRLRAAGLEVHTGVLERECRALIEAFRVYIAERRPFVVLKAAVSLDGRLASRSGDARWITSEPARAEAHRLRGELDAVLVGRGTVAADDPRLTCRSGARDPLRVVLDTELRTPPSARIVRVRSRARTLFLCGPDAPAAREKRLLAAGALVERVRTRGGRVALPAALKALHALEVQSVLVEGGGEVFAGFLGERLVDKVHVFVAPVLLGGEGTPALWPGFGARTMADALRLKEPVVTVAGPDAHLVGYL